MTQIPTPRATRESSRVALVTCAELAELERDDQLLLAPLRARGVAAQPAVWDDPTVDWSGFDLTVLRSPWDYVPRRERFLAWAATVPALANPADVVTWNTDKHYLADLADAGVPVVDTTWVAPGEQWRPAAGGEVVIKPAVGAGSKDAGRYRLDDAVHRRLAGDHVVRLLRADRTVMVQPYLSAVASYGETAVVFLAGPQPGALTFSHAIRKAPMLTGPDQGTGVLYLPEVITSRVASAAELAAAQHALELVPGGTGRLLYGRVDLIPGPDGAPLVTELELTEPSLFLGHAPGAADRFAAAIAARVRPDRSGPVNRAGGRGGS